MNDYDKLKPLGEWMTQKEWQTTMEYTYDKLPTWYFNQWERDAAYKNYIEGKEQTLSDYHEAVEERK